MRTGGSMRRRLLDCGGVTVAVESDQPRIDDAIGAMFVDIAISYGEPQATLEVRQAPHGFDVGPRAGPHNAFMTPSQALRELVRLVNRAALDHDPERLHLHGAALAINGCGLLLSAPSGTGKTTTAAALVLSGADYITDETVSIDQTADELRGFPKPMTIRRGAAELLPDLENGAVRVNQGSAPPWIVPVSALGGRPIRGAAPSVIAILDRPTSGAEPGCRGDPIVAPMRRADACVALIRQSLDFDRFGPLGLELIARLCARSHCVNVCLGVPEATAAALRDVVDDLGVVSSEEVQPEPCRKSPNSNAPGWIADDAVRWVMVGRSVVLHHQRSRAVLSLHDEGADWWLSTAASAQDTIIASATPDFVEFLQIHEFVRRCNEH